METAISQVVLSRLFDEAIPQARLGKKIQLACFEGQLYDVAACMVADHLELEGFEVLFLGANVSADSLLQRVAAERPDLLAL